MLKITLYKNCILNETYQNVISTGIYNNNSILERYLSTLTSFVINDIEYAYQENKGTLIFDYEINNGDIYEYNYMKVECYSDEDDTLILKRYCFIQDIILNNECVYIEYEEDIWSSYSDKISKITESYLERARVLDYNNKHISLRTLPTDYDGNNKIEYERIYQSESICLFCKMQIYTVGQAGEQQYRKSVYVILSANDNATTKSDFVFTLNNARIKLEQLAYYSQLKTAYNGRKDPNLQGPSMYYEITDIIALNSDFISNTEFMSLIRYDSVENEYRVFSEVWDTYNNISVCCGYYLDNFELKEVSSNAISYNSKNIKFGNLINNFEIVNNGTLFNYRILLSNTAFEFDVCINFANTIVSIKNDYLVEIPFNYLNGETIAQQKIAREIANINNGFKIAIGTIETVAEIAGAVGSSGISLFGSAGVKTTTKLTKTLKSGTIKTVSKTSSKKGTASAIDLVGDTTSGVGKVAQGITGLVEINAPVYSTSKNVSTSANGLLNGYYGLLLFKINPDNENFVKKVINNTGYVVYEYTNDLTEFELNNPSFFRLNNINYNVLAFSSINVIGSFPRAVALVLNDILENGVKIWYNELLTEDNLVVG